MTTNKSLYRNYAPFGVRTVRGAKVGIHPSLDKSGVTRKAITHAGPGTYDAKIPECKYKNGIDWNRKLKVEEFSKWMGWKNLALLENRRFFESLNGPGTHEVDLALFKQKISSCFEDVHFTSGKRFNYLNTPVTPSPDRYFRDLYKISTIESKSFSKTPTFEWDGFVSRFRSAAPPKYLLPPNLYEVTEHDGKATADILKKRVSIRGPYDLFTGQRDETTLKGFWGPRTFELPEWFFVPPSTVDELLDTANRSRTGKFLKGERFSKRPTLRHMLNDVSLCYKNPDEPGPATYEMIKFKGIVAKPPGLYPFDTCKAQARPQPGKVSIFPGPGRYTPKVPRCMKQKRATCVFLSKYQRKIHRDFDYRSF